MTTKKLYTACKRTTLAATIAFGIAATFPMTLPNESSNSPLNVNNGVVSSNRSSNIIHNKNVEWNNLENFSNNS